MCSRPYLNGSNLEHSLFFQCRYQEGHQSYPLVGTTCAIQNLQAPLYVICGSNCWRLLEVTLSMSLIKMSCDDNILFFFNKVIRTMTFRFLQHLLPFISLVLEVPVLPVKAFRCGIHCSAEDKVMSSLGQCLSYIMPIVYFAARDCHRAYSNTRSVLWTKHYNLHTSFNFISSTVQNFRYLLLVYQ